MLLSTLILNELIDYRFLLENIQYYVWLCKRRRYWPRRWRWRWWEAIWPPSVSRCNLSCLLRNNRTLPGAPFSRQITPAALSRCVLRWPSDRRTSSSGKYSSLAADSYSCFLSQRFAISAIIILPQRRCSAASNGGIRWRTMAGSMRGPTADWRCQVTRFSAPPRDVASEASQRRCY